MNQVWRVVAAVAGGAMLSQPVSVTRISATEFRVCVPLVNAPSSTTVAEYRLKQTASGMWSIQGCYGRDLTGQTADVQLSDTTDSSVWEYAIQVGVADAPQGSFEYYGLAHGHETPLTFSLLVDGVEVSAMATGAVVRGKTCIAYQTANAKLPKNSDGSPNGVTVIGAASLRHTFNPDGMLVEHTHVLDAGYQSLTAYAAMQPASATNINRFQINALPVRTPTESGNTIDVGTLATTYSAWHVTDHQYRLNMSLPSGGPDINGDWSHAGPDYGFFLDDASRKMRICYVGSTYANRLNTGTTSHQTRYTVSWV